MIRKKTAVLGALLLAFLVAVGSCAATLALVTKSNGMLVEGVNGDVRDFSELNRVMDIIQAKHLNEYSDEELMYSALRGITGAIDDRYADYFTTEEYQQYEQENEGDYVGIGMTIQQAQETGLIEVLMVFDGSPALQAGIRPGDILTHVEGESIQGLDSTAIANRVKGEEGTYVNLTFVRGEETFTIPVQRRKVTTRFVSSSMLSGSVGYIRILEFVGTADKDFERAVQQLTAQGAEGLVIDLRDNPGGSEDVVCNIADLLMPEGPIITLETREGVLHTNYSDEKYLGLPLVVLVNGNSASASELLSGSLQDTQMATIVGTRTFGKGIAQQCFETEEGVVKITTCRYTTAGGRCPHEVGIVPDLEVEPSEELAESYLYGSEADNQLREAVTMLERKMSAQ